MNLKNLTGAGVATLVTIGTAEAAPGYTLPSSGSTGILQSIETSLDNIANFVSQPLGVFVVVVAFIFSAACWIFAPKSGALAIGARAVAALIVVFNLTAIITYFTYGTTN